MSTLPPANVRESLEQLRLQNEYDREMLRSRKLKRTRQLLENAQDWVTPYGDYLDRLRREPVTTGGPASLWQRRGGRNYPVYQNETELAIFRAQARVLASTNGYVRGLRRGLTSYVVADLTYRAVAKPGQNPPEELVTACQATIDEFIERTEWQGGELPSLEKEFFWSSIEDGDALLHHVRLDEGLTEVRTVEPEQLTQPPNSDHREWSFGINTHPNDVQKPLAYYVVWGETANDGEEVSPDDLTHLRRNAKRGMKRGMTDLAFDTYDLFQLASRLCAAMGDGAAQQAAIVGIREHATATQAQIEDWVDVQKDFDAPGRQGNSEPNEYRYRGRWEDVAKGLTYVNGPSATNGPIYTQILQALLRSAGVPWNAPEWLISGDASNNNFASSLVGESPFVRGVEGEQGILCPTLRRTMFVVLRNRSEANRLYASGRYWSWAEIQRYIDVKVEAKSPETRNKIEEAQTAAIEIPLGVDSRQRYTQSKGRDWGQISQDNKEFAAENTPPDAAQMPPIPGANPEPPEGQALTESAEWELDADEYLELLESADVLEAGPKVPKKITVKTKTGTTYTKTVMVNPKAEPKKKATKAKPEPEAKKLTPKAEAKAAAQTAVAKALKDPQKLTAKELAGLGAHLQNLTVAELGEIKKAVGAKGGTRKADIADRISKKVAELKAAKKKTEPKPKAEAKPKKTPEPKPEPKGKTEPIKAPLDTQKVADTTKQFVADHVAKHGVGGSIGDLYAKLKEQHPDMTDGEFHDTLRAMHDTNQIRLSGWSKTLHEMPDDKGLFVSQKVMGYVQPASANIAPSPMPPLPPRHPQNKVDSAVSDYVSKHPKASFDQLHEHLSEQFPNLSAGQFQDTLRGLQDAGKIKLEPWKKTLHELPDNEGLSFFQGKKPMYYISKGSA